MIFLSKNIRHLRKLAGMTQGYLADNLGVNANTISNYEKGNSSPDFLLLEKIIKILDVDAHSILYTDLSAVDNIFITKTPEKVNKKNVTENVTQIVNFPKLQKGLTIDGGMITEQQVPVYESVTLQSLESLFSNSLKPNSYLSLPNLPKCDGAVRMWGDTMSPELQSGDLLVYKKVRDLRNGLFLGQIYLLSVELEGEEYIMVQYVEQSDVQESVKLVSKNERYPAKDVPLDSIKALAMIKASVRYRAI